MIRKNTIDTPVFIILGASLDTGNLGVSALLAATVNSHQGRRRYGVCRHV